MSDISYTLKMAFLLKVLPIDVSMGKKKYLKMNETKQPNDC